MMLMAGISSDAPAWPLCMKKKEIAMKRTRRIKPMALPL
jgi:hypothetical protein